METIGTSGVAESPKNEQSSKITRPPEASDFLSYSGIHLHQHWRHRYWRLFPILDAVADARIATARRRAKKAARRVPVQTVLLTAVEVPSREADLAHVIRRICSTTRHNISVATARMEPVGKFENVNRAICGYNLENYNWLLIVDDDIEVHPDFLDLLIYFAITNRFKLSQPAHKYYSYSSFKITQRHWGSQARRTGFVEIGPVSLLHTDTFAHLIPFPSLRWSWGLDVFWAQVAKRQGWRIGVIDAAPIRHLRPVGSSYDTIAAKNEAIAFLSSQAVTITKAEMFDVNERIA